MTLSDRALRRLTWASAAVVVVGVTAEVGLEIAAGSDEWIFSVGLLIFPAVGFLVVARRPRNSLGWLMVSMGFVSALPLDGYGRYALANDLPLGAESLALSGAGWVPFIAISGYLLLLFPDGHLPSPRWRWFAWAGGIGMGLLAVFIWLDPGPMTESGYPHLDNPLGVSGLGPVLDALALLPVVALFLVLGGALGLVLRMRKTTDDVVRHQIRWLAYDASLIAVLFLISFIPGAGNDQWTSLVQTLSALSFALIPIAIGVAVLRYRLYDIDVVIRKTVVIAVVVGVIAIVYVAVVAGVGALVGGRSGAPFLSALAAAIVALVFQPVRARARRLADRLVYGKRATPYEVMATFGDQLAGTYASDDVLPRTARVLGEGVGAESAEVRMAVADGMRTIAVWPTETADEHRRSGAHEYVAQVRHRGELLGELAVLQPANDPMDPTREQLVQDLAAQAGLALRNERLTGELRARLADLQAAQRRLVAAQDGERRKLERNIHDGAQQQLVALAVKARLARQLTDRDLAKVTEMLEQIERETQTALEDLRDLARGIYPPLLADKGLAAALEAQLRRSAVPARLEAEGLDRFSQEAEAAVYFSCLEALQNVAKYADAEHVSVSLRYRDGGLTFLVVDDGVGFDPAATGYGTGFQGIADRLGALEGSLRVTSAPGRGTTLEGSVPATPRDQGVASVTGTTSGALTGAVSARPQGVWA